VHVASAYRLLKELTILDPTCGSGAFLFAALHILLDVYSVVVDKAEELLAEGEDTSDRELAAIVEELKAHPSREYFILKTIVLSNLYGLDIMEEATEIARLRLFLALVARLQSRSELEPLPDLDMNIRAGNLLVGVTTPADAERQFEGSLLATERLPGVVRRAQEAGEVYQAFVDVQRAGLDGEEMDALKDDLRDIETNYAMNSTLSTPKAWRRALTSSGGALDTNLSTGLSNSPTSCSTGASTSSSAIRPT
jgi:hypothetical protein